VNSLQLIEPGRQGAGARPGRRAAAPPAAGTPVIVAVDLARTKWVTVCRWAGAEQRRLSTPGALEHLQAVVREYLAQGCPVQVVYEACGFGYELAWWVAAQPGATVLVVAPSTVERAPGNGVKTDQLDAGGLAFKAERGVLKGIAVPTRAQHRQRQLSRTYEQLLRNRRREQARVRLLLQEHGYTQAPARPAGWAALASWVAAEQAQWPAPLQLCVAEFLNQRAAAEASAQRVRRALVALASQPPDATRVAALAAQPGVGRFTAVRLVLELGTMERFATAAAFANYLGLTPGEASSGPVVHRRHLRKCGPSHIRAWLLQCAWAAIRSGADAGLSATFARLAPRLGRKRAIVAVARRLALRLRARWLASAAAPPPEQP
jgi:transposase